MTIELLHMALFLHCSEIPKGPLGMTPTTVATSLQTAISTIIPVKISACAATSATSNTIHVQNTSSVVRGAVHSNTHPTPFTHIPRGEWIVTYASGCQETKYAFYVYFYLIFIHPTMFFFGGRGYKRITPSFCLSIHVSLRHNSS